MSIFLALGANLGKREETFKQGISELERAGIRIVKQSSVYETEPFGVKDQPWFLNMVMEVETDLSPEELLKKCLEIENQFGRGRDKPWGPRTIDIDILLYHDKIISTPTLIIPHIGIPQRKFVLVPLHEIAPDTVHPIFKKTVQELLNECTDDRIVRPHDAAGTQNQSHGASN